MCSHHDVDVVGTSLNILRIHLRETASYRHLHAGLLALERSDVAQVAKQLISCVLSDTAGIKNYDISVFQNLCGFQTISDQNACKSF
jgi:hypothetical protein